jgi:hypothetical protein
MRKSLFVLLILFGMAAIGLGVMAALSRPTALPLPPKKPGALRIVAANLNYLNGQAGDVTRTLLGTGFDVAVITEWTGRNAFLEPFEQAGYAVGFDYPRPEGTHGLCVIHRKAIHGEFELVPAPVKSPCRMPLVMMRMEWGSRYVALLGAHAPPPVPACKDANLPTLRAMAGWMDGGGLERDLPPGMSGDAVILAGDLNIRSTDGNVKVFQDAGLVDATDFGSALKPTWSPFGFIPSLARIDYIWVGKGLAPLGAWSIDMSGSDHRAVVADIGIR